MDTFNPTCEEVFDAIRVGVLSAFGGEAPQSGLPWLELDKGILHLKLTAGPFPNPDKYSSMLG
jgi:hypothetical protein